MNANKTHVYFRYPLLLVDIDFFFLLLEVLKLGEKYFETMHFTSG